MELHLALRDRHTTDLVLATFKRILERFKCTVQANDEVALRAALECLRVENARCLSAPGVVKGDDTERYPGCFLEQVEAGSYEISRMLPPGNTYYYLSFQLKDKRVAVAMDNELTKEKLNTVSSMLKKSRQRQHNSILLSTMRGTQRRGTESSNNIK